MKDRCNYNTHDPWYINNEELKADPHLRAYLRRTYAEKIGKIQVAFVAVIMTAILGLMVRHVEYSYLNQNKSDIKVCNTLLNEIEYNNKKLDILQNKINSVKFTQDKQYPKILQLWATDELKRNSYGR